jgi:hypothetical protein
MTNDVTKGNVLYILEIIPSASRGMATCLDEEIYFKNKK